MATKRLNIQTRVDARQTKRELQKTSQEFKDLGTKGALAAKDLTRTFNALEGEIRDVGRTSNRTSTDMTGDLGRYNRNLDATIAKTRALRTATAGMTGIGAAAGVGGLGTALSAGAAGYAGVSAATKTASNSMAEYARVQLASIGIQKKAFEQTQKLSRGMKDVKGSSTALISNMKALGIVVAGLFAASYLKRVINYGDELGKLSTRLGVNVKELDKLRQVAELGGVSFRTLTMGLQRMTRRVAEAAGGTGEAVGALDELGLSAQKLAQLKPEDQFRAISEQLMKVESSSDRVRLAFKLFDAEGVSLVQMMGDLDKKMEETNSNFDESKTKQMERFNDQLTKLKEIFTQISVEILDKVLPALTAFTDWFLQDTSYIDGLNRKLKTVNENIKQLEGGSSPQKEAQLKALYYARKRIQDQIDAVALSKDDPSALKRASGWSASRDVKLAPGASNKPGKSGVEISDFGAPDGSVLSEINSRWQELNSLKQEFINENMEMSLNQFEYQKYLLSLEADKYKELVDKKMITLDQYKEWYKGNMEEITNSQTAAIDAELESFFESYEEGLNEYKEQQAKIVEELSRQVSSGLSEALFDWIDGVKSAEDAFRSFAATFLKNIANMIIQQTIFNAIKAAGSSGGWVGQAFSFVGGAMGISGKAAGGPVRGNVPYIVGEKGPELFVPTSAGYIEPNNTLGGSKIENNISVSVDASGSNATEEDSRKMAEQVSMAIENKMNEWAVRNMRPGGMLNRGVK